MGMGMKSRFLKALVTAASVLLLGAVAPAHAQTLANDDPVLQRIWDEAMNNSDLERLGQFEAEILPAF